MHLFKLVKNIGALKPQNNVEAIISHLQTLLNRCQEKGLHNDISTIIDATKVTNINSNKPLATPYNTHLQESMLYAWRAAKLNKLLIEIRQKKSFFQCITSPLKELILAIEQLQEKWKETSDSLTHQYYSSQSVLTYYQLFVDLIKKQMAHDKNHQALKSKSDGIKFLLNNCSQNIHFERRVGKSKLFCRTYKKRQHPRPMTFDEKTTLERLREKCEASLADIDECIQNINKHELNHVCYTPQLGTLSAKKQQ